MRQFKAAVLFCVLVTSLACAGRSCASREVALTISAAASLSDALQELKAIYLKRHAEIGLDLNLGASGTLQVQIENGAPVDLFVSAGTKPMERLVSLGLVDSSAVRPFARNRLVLIVPAVASKEADVSKAADATENPHGAPAIQSIRDLARSDVRKIAIGDEKTVPAGLYAAQSLRHFGLYEAVKERLVPATDVRQVLQYVASGAVEAGFVYATDAMGESGVRIVEEMPASAHDRILYPIAPLIRSEHAKEASELESFLLGPDAAAVLVAHGFQLATASPDSSR